MTPEERLKQLEKLLPELLEAAEDMRCYTHSWDWKYGEWWDAVIARAHELVRPA